MDFENTRKEVNWRLNNVSISTTTRRVQFDNYEKPHSAIIIKLDVERISHGFIHQIVIPALIISYSNVLYLTLDPQSYERLVLLVLNVAANTIYIEQLRWMLPHDDNTPTFLMFFFSSQFMTVILIFLTIYFSVKQNDEKLEDWNTKLLSDVEEYRIGKVFVMNIFEANDDMNIKQKWNNFTRRLIALIFAITYSVMFFKMFTQFATE